MSFVFEMDSDLIVVQRNIYTILDVLGDIGGFMSIFVSGLSFLIALWNYNNYEYHFLTNFFKKKALKTTANNKVHASVNSIENFEPKHICNIQEYLLYLMPCLRKLSCCRYNSKQAALEKARQALNKEVNIIEIIKLLRYLKLAMKKVLPKNVRDEAKKSSRYVILENDEDGGEK